MQMCYRCKKRGEKDNQNEKEYLLEQWTCLVYGRDHLECEKCPSKACWYFWSPTSQCFAAWGCCMDFLCSQSVTWSPAYWTRTNLRSGYKVSNGLLPVLKLSKNTIANRNRQRLETTMPGTRNIWICCKCMLFFGKEITNEMSQKECRVCSHPQCLRDRTTAAVPWRDGIWQVMHWENIN